MSFFSNRRKHGDPFPLPAYDLQRQLIDSNICMPQRGPWICHTLSKLAIREFNSYVHEARPAPTIVQEAALERIHKALCKAGNPDKDLTKPRVCGIW